MKIEHDFFKFYFVRLFAYKSNRCNKGCNEIQTVEHLSLNCRQFLHERKEL